MKTILLVASALCLAQNPQPPSLSLTKADAKVTVKGGGIAGSYAFNRVGSLASWGPVSGGLLVIQNEKDETFQYTAAGKPGTYKTSVAAPLAVQLGKGPQVKVMKSAAGECSVNVTKADESGVAGTFDCGRLTMIGTENKIIGTVDALNGSFSASK